MDIEKVQALIKQRSSDPQALIGFLEELHPASIADVLRDRDQPEVMEILDLLPSSISAEVFALLEPEAQEELAETLSSTELAELLTEMPADDRVDLARRLPEDMVDAALEEMDDKEREDMVQLSLYPEGTIGSIMTTAFVNLPATLSVQDAISELRRQAHESETIYVSFVTDSLGVLVGTVSLKNLIMASPTIPVSEVMNTDLITILDTDDRENAAEIMSRYNLLALAVINEEARMLGIVTHDDVIDVINQEYTEDMEKFMGITGAHEDSAYLRTPVWVHFKNRIGWVFALAIVGFFTGTVLKGFEGTLANLMLLALFMPMLTDTGGNVGSQSATVIIRALAMHEISFRDAFRVLGKELRVALLTSLILAIVAFVRVMFLASDSTIPAGLSIFAIGGTIALALALQVITSAAIGSLLPIIATRLKLDPAIVASPAITTVVDILGILIYFNLARLLLGV